MSAKCDKCSLPITNGPGFARINCLSSQNTESGKSSSTNSL
uniref:Similar to high affinity sulfate transporter 2 n=1 Tax=Arabidopsis thaliana TaxID=3702 RepID=Q8W479_ARATH|nr:similar to high affinity sulfate transporter 2 [Arabidopsis thaliana]AAM10197.1 similar to high affinity sulfate transporter 2/sp/P53392 [Arabidopsis thaliana]BAD94463.1 hypothetical protein [Arabidopsis thaliana]